ncbi:hypothetical protein AWV80_22055 [Cupriavidus sp. UYMU48A]|nr:hypothetical protein AWV80_22055 [Cupriavidus sp. UYMU48A]
MLAHNEVLFNREYHFSGSLPVRPWMNLQFAFAEHQDDQHPQDAVDAKAGRAKNNAERIRFAIQHGFTQEEPASLSLRH